MCFNKKTFLFFVNNGFSLFFELLDNLATPITWPSEEDPAESCQNLPPTSWIFQTQGGHEMIWQSKQSEANVVVTNTTATTSTVISSHTTLGFVTSIRPKLEQKENDEYFEITCGVKRKDIDQDRTPVTLLRSLEKFMDPFFLAMV